MSKILVAMSGGVDSSAAAALLLRAGHEVAGGTLLLQSGAEKEADEAAAVCRTLGIPHYRFDRTADFRREVMERFAAVYRAGATPNPCILCNRAVKFPAMLEEAARLGCDAVATGHYAAIGTDPETGRYLLLRPADPAKDQTYVLYGLTQDQLAHLCFPLGTAPDKASVRELAASCGLVTADKPDSQDICFVPDGDYAGFIERLTGEREKRTVFVTAEGKRVPAPGGLSDYTVGQRKGLGVAFGRPQYVLAKDPEKNEVLLGEEDGLFSSACTVTDCNFIAVPFPKAPMRVTAKTRYSQKEAAAVIEPLEAGTVRLVFDQPQRAVTPGQAAVFFDGDRVVGGGTVV